MHIQINFDDDDPQAKAIFALLAGALGVTQSASLAVTIDPIKAIADAKSFQADDDARAKLQAERDAQAAKVQKAPETPEKSPETATKAEAPVTPPPETKPAPAANSGGPADDQITLPILQQLASSLLQAGERRSFKAILDQHDVKSLSTAPAELYPALFASLDEAVTALSL